MDPRIPEFSISGERGGTGSIRSCRKRHPRGFLGYRRNVRIRDGWRRELENELGLSRRELESARWWPNLGQAIKGKRANKIYELRPPLDKTTSDFLEFLHDRYYGKFSNASHLSWRGMRDRAWYFHGRPSKRKAEMEKFI